MSNDIGGYLTICLSNDNTLLFSINDDILEVFKTYPNDTGLIFTQIVCNFPDEEILRLNKEYYGVKIYDKDVMKKIITEVQKLANKYFYIK